MTKLRIRGGKRICPKSHSWSGYRHGFLCHWVQCLFFIKARLGKIEGFLGGRWVDIWPHQGLPQLRANSNWSAPLGRSICLVSEGYKPILFFPLRHQGPSPKKISVKERMGCTTWGSELGIRTSGSPSGLGFTLWPKIGHFPVWAFLSICTVRAPDHINDLSWKLLVLAWSTFLIEVKKYIGRGDPLDKELLAEGLRLSWWGRRSSKNRFPCVQIPPQRRFSGRYPCGRSGRRAGLLLGSRVGLWSGV